MIPTADEISTAIGDLIKIEDPNANIIYEPVLGIENGDDVDIYRAPNDANIVHAWVIHRIGLGIESGETVGYSESHQSRVMRADCNWTFLIKLYYKYSNKNANGDRSQTVVDDICNRVQAKLFSSGKFGLESKGVRSHRGWQVQSMTVTSAGDSKVHLASGTLRVLLYQSIAVS